MNKVNEKHSIKILRRFIIFIIVILFSTSLWQLSIAGRIQGKAIIAQQLLKNAWQTTLQDEHFAIHKPWPWADTWPVASLSVPQYNIEQIVLSGDSGSSLAFGPGHSLASAYPNTNGVTVISGHRDTHFNFLKRLKVNDILHIQTRQQSHNYQIYDFQIVNSKHFKLDIHHGEQNLILVTCYPFNSITTGGTLRYLVFARVVS